MSIESNIPLAWFVTEAIRRSADKGIELASAGPFNLVFRTNQRGHYLRLEFEYQDPVGWDDSRYQDLIAQIIAVDCYVSTPGTYDDLLPGFVIEQVSYLGVPDCPEEAMRYASVLYKFDAELFERTVLEPLRPKI